MGIRFQCHHCEFELHVKDFQAGRRGRCPKCQGRFRVPQQSAEFSEAIEAEAKATSMAAVTSKAATRSTHSQRVLESSEDFASAASGVEEAVLQHEALQKKALFQQELEQSGDIESTALQKPGDMPPPMGPGEIAETREGVWYVRPTSGGQFGPAPSPTFVQWLHEGRITRDALVWRDGWPEWVSGLQAFPDYFGPESPHAHAASPADVIASSHAHTPAPALGIGVDPHLPTATSDSAGPASVAAPSLGERNRIGRKRKKRRRYIVMLSILTVLFFCLITALVAVITLQK